MFLAKFIKLTMFVFFIGLVSLLPFELQPQQTNSRTPASILSRTKTLNIPAQKTSFSAGENVSILLSQKCLIKTGTSSFLREHLSEGIRLQARDWQTINMPIKRTLKRSELENLISNDPCIFEIHFPSQIEE